MKPTAHTSPSDAYASGYRDGHHAGKRADGLAIHAHLIGGPAHGRRIWMDGSPIHFASTHKYGAIFSDVTISRYQRDSQLVGVDFGQFAYTYIYQGAS